MPSIDIVRRTPIKQTPRLKQLQGMFDLPEQKESVSRWKYTADIESIGDWNIGLIVGPSGSGKTTVANELFGVSVDAEHDWSADRSVVDDFPPTMSIKEITILLSSVGFSSPPSWCRPYSCLSNGEQFRVRLARTLAEEKGISVIDEFTSVVDRQVAKIGSSAVAKVIRKTDRKFVVVSCHYDIIEWLDPDWIYEPEHDSFQWRCERQSRPEIKLEIFKVHRKHWSLFRRYHYLTETLSKAAPCFMATIEGKPVAWIAVINFPHPINSMWKAHRVVVLPEYQGVGIGNRMEKVIASAYKATGRDYAITTSHPGLIASKSRSKEWKMIHHGMMAPQGRSKSSATGLAKTSSSKRLTATFKYAGEACPEYMRQLGINPVKQKKKTFSLRKKNVFKKKK